MALKTRARRVEGRGWEREVGGRAVDWRGRLPYLEMREEILEFGGSLAEVEFVSGLGLDSLSEEVLRFLVPLVV